MRVRLKRGHRRNVILAPLVALTGYFGCAVAHASLYSQATIDAAVALPLHRFVNTPGNELQNAPMEPCMAINFMAQVVHQDPAATNSAGDLVRSRLLAQLRNILIGGHEPNANGSLSGWTHGTIAQAFLLAKNTPTVWSQLAADEKSRMDWIMKALAIAGHFGFDDGNDFRTGLGNEGNFNKLSNPNYREGYVGVVLAASLYFGATELNTIFTNFNYTTYTNQFAAFGFSNVLARWGSYNWKPILENGGSDAYGGHGAGVRNEFKYRGIGLTNRFGIFKKLADIMYGVDDSGVDTNKAPWVATSTVIDGLTNSGIGYSWTLNNGHSPYLGQRGQCYEFHATQGHGSNPTPRSDINYVCEGWNNSVATRASLQALGYWTGPVADVNDVESRMQVGSDDLISKAQNGFAGYSASTYQPVRYEADLQNRGYYYTKDLWLKALRSAPLPCNSAAAGGGWINTSIAAQTTTCVVEFDATPSLSPINSVIGLSCGVAQSYANLATIVRFNPDGSIDARNGGGYAASSAIAYSAHQNCHFRLVINLSNHTYSAYVARAGDAEVAIGLDYAFRTEQMGVSRLDNVAWHVGSTNGANTVCSITTVPLRTIQAQIFGGSFVVRTPAVQGEVCLLETSSNLITWASVSTNIASSDTGVTFTNTSPGQPCFYRVRYRQ